MSSVRKVIHEAVLKYFIGEMFRSLELPPRPAKQKAKRKKVVKKNAAPVDPLRQFGCRQVVQLWKVAKAIKVSLPRLRLWAARNSCLYGTFDRDRPLRIGMPPVRANLHQILAECGRQRPAAPKPAPKKALPKKPAKKLVTKPAPTPTPPAPTRIATPVPTVPAVPDPLEGLRPYAPVNVVALRLGITIGGLKSWGEKKGCLGGKGDAITISVAEVRKHQHYLKKEYAPKRSHAGGRRKQAAAPASTREIKPVPQPVVPAPVAGPDMQTVLFEAPESAEAEQMPGKIFYLPGNDNGNSGTPPTELPQ